MTAQAEEAQVVPGDLGELLAEFRDRFVPVVVAWLAIGATIGSIIWHGGALPYVIAGVVVGVVVAAGLSLLSFRSSRQPRVKLYSGGLVYRAKRATEVWKWGEVEEFFIRAEKREIRTAQKHVIEFLFEKLVEAVVWLLLPKAAKYRVSYELRRPGHKCQLTSSIRGYRKLGEMVEEFVTEVQLPVALASFRSGDVVTFGKLLLGQDGLVYASTERPRFLPLSELAGVSVSRYDVKVRQVGRKHAWLTPDRSAVPNGTVLAGLAERIVADRDLHDGDEASGEAGSGQALDTQQNVDK